MSVDFILRTISSIFFILNEFKYEDDKRLLGYVLIHELYKDVSGNEKSSNVSPIIDNVMKKDTVDDVKAIKNENSSVVENVESNDTVYSNNEKNIHSGLFKINETIDLTGKMKNGKSDMTL